MTAFLAPRGGASRACVQYDVYAERERRGFFRVGWNFETK